MAAAVNKTLLDGKKTSSMFMPHLFVSVTHPQSHGVQDRIYDLRPHDMSPLTPCDMS